MSKQFKLQIWKIELTKLTFVVVVFFTSALKWLLTPPKDRWRSLRCCSSAAAAPRPFVKIKEKGRIIKEWLLFNTRQHSPNSCSNAGYYTKMFYFT
jgi:hypothetical protein